jgi:hypothetical protein
LVILDPSRDISWPMNIMKKVLMLSPAGRSGLIVSFAAVFGKLFSFLVN